MIQRLPLRALLFVLIFLTNYNFYGQTESSLNYLGNQVVQSITTKDINSFKKLLLPKEIVMDLLKKNVPKKLKKKEKKYLLEQAELAYDKLFIPEYEKNFWKIVNLAENELVILADLKFEVINKYTSKEHPFNPKVIHSVILSSEYNHLYFGAINYKGKWYLSSQTQIEILKDEKYEPNDNSFVKNEKYIEIDENEIVSFEYVDDIPITADCNNEFTTREELKKCVTNSLNRTVGKLFDVNLAQDLGIYPGKHTINSSFIIDTNGNIVNIEASSEYIPLKNEMIRVIGLIPKMKPGKHKGEVVNVEYELPIRFIVQE